jgi:hypothetical protein
LGNWIGYWKGGAVVVAQLIVAQLIGGAVNRTMDEEMEV